jgi:hypothetical protein
MADPPVLYVVSTIVVLALVAWVIAVNATAPPAVDVTKAPAPPPPDAPPEATVDDKAAAKAETKAETKSDIEAEAKAEEKANAPAEQEPRAEAAAHFEPERPSRSGLRGDYLDIQDDPKGGDGSGEG